MQKFNTDFISLYFLHAFTISQFCSCRCVQTNRGRDRLVHTHAHTLFMKTISVNQPLLLYMKATLNQYKPSQQVSFHFEAVYLCQLQKQVNRDVMNTFHNGLCEYKTTKKQCIWLHRLPETINSFEEKGSMPCVYANENEQQP